MKLGNGSWLETLTYELYEEWEIGFETLLDMGLILCSFSGRSRSDLKRVIFETWDHRCAIRLLSDIRINQDKPGKLTSFRWWCQSYFGLITTQSTANEPRRLGDQSRQTGWIRSRITSRVVERLWSNRCFRWFMTNVKWGGNRSYMQL